MLHRHLAEVVLFCSWIFMRDSTTWNKAAPKPVLVLHCYPLALTLRILNDALNRSKKLLCTDSDLRSLAMTTA